MARRLIIIVALLALIGAGCEVGTAEDAETPAQTVTVVPVPDGAEGAELDPDQEQTELERPAGVDGHEDSKDETPPGVTPEDVAGIEDSRPAGIDETPAPLGGAENLSCRRNLVRNHSARAAGSVVSMFVLHYTVSNPGTLDVIRGLFNTPSFGASSTFLLEPLTGRCELIVDPSRKAWTQGAFNSVAESVEIVCCRSDPSRQWWLDSAIVKRGLLAELVANRLRARGLPNRLVDPGGCTPLAGWTDHNRLDCGNTHVDVGRNFPFDVVRAQIAAKLNPTPTLVLAWQARSGGKVLRQERARTIAGVGGYDRLLGWMRNAGEGAVRAAEKANGDVRIILVEVPAG